MILTDEDGNLIVPQATATGYEVCIDGGVFDIAYPSSSTRRGRVQDSGRLCPTLTCSTMLCVYLKNENTMEKEEPNIQQVGNINDKNAQAGRIYSCDGLAPAIDVMQGGNTQPKIIGYTRDSKGYIQNRHFNNIANTLNCSTGSGGNTDQYVSTPRIRKLTERECFRLMGLRDADIDTIQSYRDETGKPLSKSQQYKMAGNSIVVDVLMELFRKLFIDKECETQQLSFF